MQGRKEEKMEKFNLNEENAGFYGMVFECAIKKALGKNAVVSPCGRVDLQKGKKYEIKQNGGELFPVSRHEIKGVSMVIYAPFIDMSLDLEEQTAFVVERHEFLEILESTKCLRGCKKSSDGREVVSVQTLYNYKLNAPHGAKGRKLIAEFKRRGCKTLAEWLSENT